MLGRSAPCLISRNSSKRVPSGCRADGESSVFTFTGREIEIVFHKSADRVSISLRIDHSEGLHDISLTGEVLPPSGKPLRAFTQGFGMEGPSGMVTVGSDRAVSHGLIALCGEHSSLFSYVKDHTTFSTRFTIQKSTTIFDEPVTFFQAGFNLENAASGPLTLPALFFFEKEEKDPQNGLRECAEDIAAFMNARHAMPPAFHWCSWYYHYQNFSQKHLEEYLEG